MRYRQLLAVQARCLEHLGCHRNARWAMRLVQNPMKAPAEYEAGCWRSIAASKLGRQYSLLIMPDSSCSAHTFLPMATSQYKHTAPQLPASALTAELTWGQQVRTSPQAPGHMASLQESTGAAARGTGNRVPDLPAEGLIYRAAQPARVRPLLPSRS